MIEISFAQMEAWLSLFLWPFTRITSFILASPIFGHSSVPARVKIGLGIFLTIIISTTLPALPSIPFTSWSGLGILTEQIIIGLSMGLALHIMFTVVQSAGEFIGMQMGLGFASFFSPETGTNTVILSRILYLLTLLIFVTLNAHLLIIETLANSFVTLPIGFGTLNAGAFELLVRFASSIFSSGLLFALPLMSALLVINLGMGILNRAAPQFTIFSIGFPITLIVGIFMLSILMNDLGRFLEDLFSQGLQFLNTLLETMK
ncbi:MAG: flagellar biosynthetic protein FliR [Porticoccus sp.]